MNLSGTVPRFPLQNFAKQMTFEFTNCSLHGTFPFDTLKMNNLKWLRLGNNDFSGSVKFYSKNYTHRILNDNLQLLNLSLNKFEGELDCLTHFTNLKYLSIYGNNFKSIKCPLPTSVQYFVAKHNQNLKCDFGFLFKNVSNISVISISNTQINGHISTDSLSSPSHSTGLYLELYDSLLSGSMPSYVCKT